MGGPWEKYQNTATAEEGPWTKYAEPSTPESAPMTQPEQQTPFLNRSRVSDEGMQKGTHPLETIWAGSKQGIEQYGRPVVEGLALGTGALVGAPLGPAGAALGAGLAYSAANQTLYPEKRGSFTEAGKDVISGAATEAGGQVAGKVIEAGVAGAGKVIKPVLGRMSSTGTAAVEEALQSGKSTGLSLSENPLASKTAYDKALRGEITPEDVVNNAKASLNDLKFQRATAYQQKLTQIAQNNKEIDTTPINNKLEGLMARYNVKIGDKGKVDTSRIAMGKTGRNDIEDIVQTVMDWGKTNPEDKTPLGLDTLKRQLDDFYSDSSQAREFVTSLNNEVKKTISNAVPEYASMTKGYAEATSLIKDIEAGLMMRKQGMTGRIVADQTLRRLTSTMKDNKELSRELVTILGNKTNTDLTGQIAGATMNAPLPHGLAGTAPSIMVGGAALHMINPSFLPVIAASSPRVQGEFLRLFGKVLAETAGTAPIAGRVASYGYQLSKKKAIQNSNLPEVEKQRFLDQLNK